MEITFLRLKRNRFGGAERYLERLITQLSKRNIWIKNCHSSLSHWVPGWLRVLHFNFICCWKKPPHTLYFSLERVLCSDIYRAGDGVHKKFLQLVPKKGWWLNPLHWVYLSIEPHLFRRARRIIANSNLVKRQILECYPEVPREKIKVIYNGVPVPEKVRKGEPELRRELGIGEDEVVLLFVGSGFKRKGVRELLHLLPHLSPDLRGEWRLVVVGKEKRLSKYQQLARDLGLEGEILFTGPRSDIERFYRMGDILILPTYYDPFANVVLEGLVHANVVFTTQQNGASEILPVRWVMESPTDPTFLPRLERLIESPTYLRQEQKLAREIGSSFSIERNVEETLKVIEEVIREIEGEEHPIEL
ncbi:MAG: glycosyltransferase family 4 protein [Campylobacterales bacterium]